MLLEKCIHFRKYFAHFGSVKDYSYARNVFTLSQKYMKNCQ